MLSYDLSRVNVYKSEDMALDISYLFIHENSLSTQLCLSTVLELMAYADEYPALEAFETIIHIQSGFKANMRY
ncbi:hypothetical protein GLOIN_2v1884564 [Rhizophagus clarus]|uniref:Uncharacterized protein n=1 Tax=Rhizophagus clarus TaxID=94130 RepID=A0A8H3L040_9GLOM|nr:hypothetical protein GLOIN_2v1884564 [Rhizophagus clarus]